MELSDELLNIIWSVCRFCIIGVYILCKDYFHFPASCDKIIKELPKEA